MNVRLENKKYLAITELYAFICEEPDGEGVMAFWNPGAGGWIPMIGADLARVDALKKTADEICAATGKKYVIRYFKAATKP